MCYFDAAKPFCAAVKHTSGYQTLCDVTKGTTFTLVTLAITIYYNRQRQRMVLVVKIALFVSVEGHTECFCSRL